LLTLNYLELLLQPVAAEVAAAAAQPVAEVDADPRTAPGPNGLTTAEVRRRRLQAGANLVPELPRRSFFRRFLQQYQDTMQLTLIGGAGLSLLAGHRRDALTIGAVLLLNGLIGASQDDGKARSVAALRALVGQAARVVRDGVEQTVPAAELVPGDLILLAAGDRVPADAAVLTATGLAVDESLQTGECTAVDKSQASAALAAGTPVVRGRGQAIVTATGGDSTLGRIGALLEGEERPAPLQRQMDQLGRRAGRIGLWVAAGVTGMALLRGQGLATALTAGVSLAISAIPEGLPTFVTLALATGARRMRRQGGTFQNLGAVESMGAVTALCCDKTGTITQGQMAVAEVRLTGSAWRITGEGYCPDGAFHRIGAPGEPMADPLADPAMRRLLKVLALCNNARLGLDDEGALVTHGDPTELALLVAGLKAGLRASGGEGDRLLEVPFDADRRRMTVVCRDAMGQAMACAKGAPEVLLPRCDRVFIGGVVRRMDSKLRRKLLQDATAMAARGLRVLAAAYRPVPLSVQAVQAEKGLIFLGLAAMTDPPRPEAAEAVRRCKAAGIRVLMITGDHPATAATTAREVGLDGGPGSIVSGEQLALLSDAELGSALAQAVVVARATPAQKLRVVRALRQGGHVVAMTGDGVNDAPAMREADIGIAMGDRGTEVARATAGLVLEADDLLTLVAAIAQGRTTRGNVRRTARYLLGSNVAEVCLMGAALLLGLPLPLLPVQLLWMNLAGDGLPAAVLGDQPPEPDVMRRPPEAGGDLLGPGFSRKVLGHGLRTGLAATALYAWALGAGRPLAQARSLAVATLAAAQVRHLYVCRSSSGAGQVRTAGAAAAAMSLGALLVPPLRGALQLAPLGVGELALAAGIGVAANKGNPA
ncbi:MAG: ATPase, partial [Firmicutes bacterium]|nr:ATPase [Bacillota bacterium]